MIVIQTVDFYCYIHIIFTVSETPLMTNDTTLKPRSVLECLGLLCSRSEGDVLAVLLQDAVVPGPGPPLPAHTQTCTWTGRGSARLARRSR